MTSTATRPFTPEDILDFELITDIALSPDGTRVVIEQTSVDREQDVSQASLALVGVEGGEPRPLTSRAYDSSSPRWSPDGRHVAFVSSRGEGPPQAFVIAVDGGEARQVTSVEGAVGELAWSPDGKRLVVGVSVDAEKAPEGMADKPAWEHRPRVVTRAFFRDDEGNDRIGQRMHLFVVDVASGEARQLTDGDSNERDAAFSPDGERVVFCRSRTGAGDSHRFDVWVIDQDGRRAQQLTREAGVVGKPSWSPDGRTVAFHGARGEAEMRMRLWTVGADGSNERPVTAEDVDVANFPLGKNTPPAWSASGDEIAMNLASHGLGQVALIDVRSGAVRPVVTGERQVTMLSAAAGAGRIAFVWADQMLCGRLATSAWDGSGERQLLNINEEWARGRAWPEVTRRRFDAPEGGSVEGWLLRPPGVKGPLPVLLYAHGGPHAYVEFGFPYHPYWHVLLSRGWAVLALNATGSASYGQDVSDALRGRWGERDWPEWLAALDTLTAEGQIDRERVVITGKSYGGFMSAHAATTGQVRAAVVASPVTNLVSFVGTSDTGYYMAPFEMRGELLDRWDTYERLSPLRWAGRIEVPVLLLHGEDDVTCPVAQSDELYVALVRLGKAPVEYVRYPGGHHHVQERGSPSHRVDICRRIVDWAERWAPAGRAPDATLR